MLFQKTVVQPTFSAQDQEITIEVDASKGLLSGRCTLRYKQLEIYCTAIHLVWNERKIGNNTWSYSVLIKAIGLPLEENMTVLGTAEVPMQKEDILTLQKAFEKYKDIWFTI